MTMMRTMTTTTTMTTMMTTDGRDSSTLADRVSETTDASRRVQLSSAPRSSARSYKYDRSDASVSTWIFPRR
jgi:hypothetical protein